MLALFLALLSPAHALESAISVGGFVNVTPSGDMLPPYGLVVGTVVVPLSERWLLIPGAGVDFAPTAGNAGVYGFGILEWITTDRIGVDFLAAVAYDHDPWLDELRGNPHTGYVGAGPGVTWFFDPGLSASFSVPILCNVEGLGCAASPGAMLTFPLAFGQ